MTGRKLSVSQFVKAMSSEGDIAKQNQAMEQINVDFVDMLEQLCSHAASHGVHIPRDPKTVHDVKIITAKCAMHLRVILAELAEPEPK